MPARFLAELVMHTNPVWKRQPVPAPPPSRPTPSHLPIFLHRGSSQRGPLIRYFLSTGDGRTEEQENLKAAFFYPRLNKQPSKERGARDSHLSALALLGPRQDNGSGFIRGRMDGGKKVYSRKFGSLLMDPTTRSAESEKVPIQSVSLSLRPRATRDAFWEKKKKNLLQIEPQMHFCPFRNPSLDTARYSSVRWKGIKK